MECVALPNYMVFEAPSPGPNLPPTDASPLGHPQDARLGFLANGLIGQGKTFTYFPLPVLTGAPIRPLNAQGTRDFSNHRTQNAHFDWHMT